MYKKQRNNLHLERLFAHRHRSKIAAEMIFMRFFFSYMIFFFLFLVNMETKSEK